MKNVIYTELSDTIILAHDGDEPLASIIKTNDKPKAYKIKFREPKLIISAKVNNLKMARRLVQFYRREMHYGNF